jgi:hypothetical protein
MSIDPKPEDKPTVNVNHVHRVIEDVHWPASRDEIVRHAEARNAPDDVLHALRRMPEGTYQGEAAVYQSALKRRPGTTR